MLALLLTLYVTAVALAGAWVTWALRRSAQTTPARRLALGLCLVVLLGLTCYAFLADTDDGARSGAAGVAFIIAAALATAAEWWVTTLGSPARGAMAGRHAVPAPADLRLRVVPGGVTAASGFAAGAGCCGLRETPDLALVVSDRPAIAAGVFTANIVKAAPVVVSQRHIADGAARAVVLNAACANAYTGEKGLRNAEAMAATTAAALGAAPEDVLVCSTGVIGRQLDIDSVAAGIRGLSPIVRPDGGADAAKAILTTDTLPKEVAVSVDIGGRTVNIGGMAKGAGMIHPSMATMLCVITTDADASAELLHRTLTGAVADSFNMVTVDGDMSTNDTVLLLANGASGVAIEPHTSEAEAWASGLRYVCTTLAMRIAADGEGATRRIDVTVTGAATEDDARRAAKAVASSLLVKTAVYGQDPNWGRVLAALGYSGARFQPEDVSLWIGDACLVHGGEPAIVDLDSVRGALGRPIVPIRADLGAGNRQASAWTCDMTEGYIHINAHYTT